MFPTPSARLMFRSWTADDGALAQASCCDPEVTFYFGGAMTPEQAQERLQMEIDRATHMGIQYWPTFLRDTGEFAGCAGLRPWSIDPDLIEAGVNLMRSAWGLRLGEEALLAVLAYAFETLGVPKIAAGHGTAHKNSRKLLERVGFEYTHNILGGLQRSRFACGQLLPKSGNGATSKTSSWKRALRHLSRSVLDAIWRSMSRSPISFIENPESSLWMKSPARVTRSLVMLEENSLDGSSLGHNPEGAMPFRAFRSPVHLTRNETDSWRRNSGRAESFLAGSAHIPNLLCAAVDSFVTRKILSLQEDGRDGWRAASRSLPVLWTVW